jgi:hypothetical protein
MTPPPSEVDYENDSANAAYIPFSGTRSGRHVQLFDEKEDYELARAVEEGLMTPPPSEVDYGSANAAYNYIPFQVPGRAGTSPGTSNHRNEDTQGGLLGLQEDGWDEQWEAFQRVRIGSAFHGIFEGHRMTRKISEISHHYKN